jgi:O-antigen/teichoic acid export membrane protein
MTEDLDADLVRRRAVRGTASLLARQLIVRVLGFAGMLVLARVLTPEIFGAFAIAQFGVLLLEQVSHLGLAAALLRRKAPPTLSELRTVFSVQQAIVASIVLGGVLGAAPLVRQLGLAEEHVWLIYAMAAALVLASLKTVPTILLERGLRHDLLATSEVAEFVIYQAVAIVLALQGFGLWALIAALLARGVAGLSMLSFLSRWTPRFAFDRRALGEILRFGLPVQLASFASMGTSAVIPLAVGSVLGASAAGFAAFSRNIADALIFQPLIIMSRVQLRVFGTMQDEPTRFARAVERSMYVGSLFAAFSAALVVSQARPFIEHVVTSKWSEALPLLYCLAPTYLVYVIAQPIMQALKALGDAHTPLYGVLLQSVVQIASVLLLAPVLGLAAYAIGLAIGLLGATWLAWRRLRSRLRLRAARSVAPALTAGVMAATVATGVNGAFAGLPGMSLSALSCVTTYALALAVLDGRRLSAELSQAVSALLPASSAARAAMRGIGALLVGLNWFHRLNERGVAGK